MGYVAVKGGDKAIEESIKRLKYQRLKEGNLSMRGLVDQIMSEGSLYSNDLANLAIIQSEGNIEEAVFLIRAYRSTLPRKYYSNTIESTDMKIERRISASFKDIVGGQILGASYDYTHRLLDFSLLSESDEEREVWLKLFNEEVVETICNIKLDNLPKVVDYLRKDGIIKNFEKDDKDPIDITKENMDFPAERSERLQSLTRGQTGAVTSLAYSALRSCGIDHPTVGELRVGNFPIYVQSLLEDEDSYYIGEFKATEVELFVPHTVKKENGDSELKFELGYGICFGQNETKAIAMSILDQCLEIKDKRYPTGDEEFVLMSIDSVESTGFISHLKLPHYVTFQSELNSVRGTSKEDKHEN